MTRVNFAFLLGIVVTSGAVGQNNGHSGPVELDHHYQVRYASNLTIGDAIINITNTGANGANLFGPGFGTPAGNICVNAYAFSPDEQLISCCSCPVTPNGLVNMTANRDLISNTLTGIQPDSIVIKLVATSTGSEYDGEGYRPTFSDGSCAGSAALAGGNKFMIADGLLAWGTTSRTCTNVPGGSPLDIQLPVGPVSANILFSSTLGLPAYLMMDFPGLAPGSDISSVLSYLAWCANFSGIIPVVPIGGDLFGSTQIYTMYNTYGVLPANAMSPNWHNVNYLLNHKNGASVAAVQEAIWFLLNGQYHANQFIPVVPPPGAQALVDDALANGNGFIPSNGQVVAILLDSGTGLFGTGLQSTIIEVPTPPRQECIRITESGFIPAKLSDEELRSITGRCANILGNGSTFGQCRSCRLGGLGGTKLQ